MFCKNCGTNNAEGVRFCAKCGSPMTAAPTEFSAPAAPSYPTQAPNYAAQTPNYGAQTPNYGAAPSYTAPTYGAAPGGSKKSNPMGAVLAAVAAIVVIILLISLFGGNSPKKVAKKTMDAMMDCNMNKVVKLMHKDVIDAVLEELDMDEDDFEDLLDEASEEAKDGLEEMEDEYDDYKISYKIKDVEDMDDDEFDDLKDMYDDDLDIKVKKAKVVEIEVTEKYDGDKEEDDMELIIVKIGGKWYLDPSSISMF